MHLDQAMEILRNRQGDLKKMGVQGLYVFGSTVRGDQQEDSDVDLFFDYDKGTLSLFDVMRIGEFSSRMLGCDAHVMTRGSINRYYRSSIEAEAVRVF